MGRPRKPTSLKLLDGDRKDRVGPAAAPGDGPGACPDWLDPIGKLAWARMAGLLGPTGLATPADAEVLSIYCVTFSTWWRATARVEAEGMTLETETTTKPHPCIGIANEAQRQMTRILSKLGLTPSDRAGLHVRERPEQDDLLSFLAGKKATGTDGKPSRR